MINSKLHSVDVDILIFVFNELHVKLFLDEKYQDLFKANHRNGRLSVVDCTCCMLKAYRKKLNALLLISEVIMFYSKRKEILSARPNKHLLKQIMSML